MAAAHIDFPGDKNEFRKYASDGTWGEAAQKLLIKNRGIPPGLEHLTPHYVEIPDDTRDRLVARALLSCTIINDVPHSRDVAFGDAQRFKGFLVEIATQNYYGVQMSKFPFGDPNGQDGGLDSVLFGHVCNFKACARTSPSKSIPYFYVFNLSEHDIQRNDQAASLCYIFSHLQICFPAKPDDKHPTKDGFSRGAAMDKRIIAGLEKIRELIVSDTGLPTVQANYEAVRKSFNRPEIGRIVKFFQDCIRELVLIGMVFKADIWQSQRGIFLPRGTVRANGARTEGGDIFEITWAEMLPVFDRNYNPAITQRFHDYCYIPPKAIKQATEEIAKPAVKHVDSAAIGNAVGGQATNVFGAGTTQAAFKW